MTLVIAHRGASSTQPENTIAAFTEAAEIGADWVELDVRLTSCGEAIVHHDALLPDGRAIGKISAAELPPDVPTLQAALLACGSMGVDIEIKNDPGDPDYDDEYAIVERVIETARQILPVESTLVTSFDMGAINRVRDIDSRVPTGLITSDMVGAEVSIGRAVAHDHRAINPMDELVSARWVDVAHEAGLVVYAWTIDDPERMAELVEFGVDGIITNKPDVARAVLDSAH